MTAYRTDNRIVQDINLSEGGLYDILFLDLIEGFPNSRIVFSLASTSEGISREGVSRRITGIQKLAQLVLKVLFTARGTDVVRPSTGTSLPFAIRGSNIGNVAELDSMIRAEVISASEQVVDMTTSKGSPYEILREASLLYAEVGQTSVEISVRVVSEAGDEASIFAPFPRFDLHINV